MSSAPSDHGSEAWSPATRLVHLGRAPDDHFGAVNVPVYRASTLIFQDYGCFEAGTVDGRPGGGRYGRLGTPTSKAFTDAMTALEHGCGAVVAPSGLAALALAMDALTEDRRPILVADHVYGPTRGYCTSTLVKRGIEVHFYDPCDLPALEALAARHKPGLILVETPGSLTFEVQDLPAIAAIARKHGAWVLADSTWATPLGLQSLRLGADIVVHAATKYIVGHSDAMLGVAVANEAAWPKLRDTAYYAGAFAGPDDIYLALRGLRTLAVRLPVHAANVQHLIAYLRQQPEVRRILHPGEQDHPGNEVYRRDFECGSGLFGIVLAPQHRAAMAAFLDGLKLFAMGFSWGGYESLILPVDQVPRTVQRWDAGEEILLRIHAGLENANDLVADLAAGFQRLRTTPALPSLVD